jgi:hypothetical protein
LLSLINITLTPVLAKRTYNLSEVQARNRSSKLSIQEPIDCTGVYVLGPAPVLFNILVGFAPHAKGRNLP